MAGLLSLGARPSSTGTQDVGPGAPAILLKRSEPVVRQIAKAVAGRSDGVAVEYKALLRERCQRAACCSRAEFRLDRTSFRYGTGTHPYTLSPGSQRSIHPRKSRDRLPM